MVDVLLILILKVAHTVVFFYGYEPVQAYHLKFRQPRMPHAIATRMSHMWYHADRRERRKRVTATFFVKDLGLALAPKMCADQSQAFKEVNNIQAFTVGSKKKVLFFFLERTASRCSKVSSYKVLRKYSKS